MKKYFFYIFLFFSLSALAQTETFKIVLDAGHGGKDPGKVHKKIFEKDIVLKIILLIGKELEKDPIRLRLTSSYRYTATPPPARTPMDQSPMYWGYMPMISTLK